MSPHDAPQRPWPRIRNLPPQEQALFWAWLRKGRTAPHIEGVPETEQDAYYPEDYNAWQRSMGRITMDEIAKNLGIDLDDIRRGGPRPKLIYFEQTDEDAKAQR